VLTVVVVAHNAGSYLSECLESLRSQTLKRIEVLVVDDGSTDGTVDVARQVAAEDRRFQILMRPQLGLTASRNEGAQIARGEFLAFVDATDTVPRNAYASLVGSLRRTGSDFAAGSVRTVIRGRRRRPAWAVMTEELGRPAQTLSEFPLAVGDTFATSRVFRRSFWNAEVGGFPAAADGEAFAIVRATHQARQFDFVRTVSCIQHTRLAPGTLLPSPLKANELESRLEWHRTTWQLVRDAADEPISGAWLGSLIDGDLGDFAADAHRADSLYRERLHEAAQEFLAMADDTVWPHVRVERKLCLWLVASRRWTHLEQLTHHFGIYGSIPRTEVREGRVYAVAEELPHIDDAPLECRELANSQTAFSGCIERVAWDGDRLELHGWAFIRGVDLATHPLRLTASLIEPETGLSHSCEVTQVHKEAANRWAMFRYQDVAPGGFVICIDTGRIGRAPGSWQLRLTVQAGDLERTGAVRAVVAGGPRIMMSARKMQRADDQNRVVPKLHPEVGFLLHVSAELVIRLAAPLTDEERSRVAQDQLGTWYQQSSFTPTKSVLFQSYRGEFATDSQLALHSELRNRRPDLELIWGVKDLSVAVPEGGRALLIESREWYSALGSSRYLCRNIDFERYFRKRPYQRYLQTFHGYPFKSMGASLWRAQGRPESVVAFECSRRIHAWDAIVVPESFSVNLYRREYGYSGEALITGYPRNDALLSKDVDSTRSRVLQQLGIEPDRVVVLYAPTWRDTVATSPWTAKMFDGLDLGQLAEELGDGYAVLLRGHNSNLREGLSPIKGHVWDVSAYPEINDLLLAADVAVLDYSSIRFDWLITGKPVMFFVPDLENYLSSRRVLFDYAPTAPGPLLTTTSEVAEELLDLGSVSSEYAAARELFNKEFNRLHDGRATERVINGFF
jgi:CDP-glycerol glycerophosphotransferase (TagB/SpsB family)/glycosyltransferase involved in cell wall biosynthesis